MKKLLTILLCSLALLLLCAACAKTQETPLDTPLEATPNDLVLLALSDDTEEVDADVSAAFAVAEQYLTSWAYSAYLYADNDLSVGTVLTATDEALAPVLNDYVVLLNRADTPSTTAAQLKKNMQVKRDEAQYEAETRNYQGIVGDKLTLSFTVNKSKKQGNALSLEIGEKASLSFGDKVIFFENRGHFVRFVKVDGAWLIADVYTWYDLFETYKTQEYDLDALIAEKKEKIDAERVDAPSAWAADEVAEAIALGIVPLWGQSDYQQSVTRAEFAALAYQFCAMQHRSTLIDDYRTLHGEAPVSFTDVDHNTSHDTEIGYAAEMGIVLGCGDGTFAPEKTITRQEAATMLLRAYRVYGGESDGEAPTLAVPDADRVADWALDGAAQMSAWNVILGTGEGLFAPETSYTREQCYLTFLRLYKNAPVSRAQGNIQPLFTAEEYVERLLHDPSVEFYLKERLESDEAIVLSGYTPTPRGSTGVYYVVYKDAQGGWQNLFSSFVTGLPSSWWGHAAFLLNLELEGTTLRGYYAYRQMTDTTENYVPVSIDLLTGEATVTGEATTTRP